MDVSGIRYAASVALYAFGGLFVVAGAAAIFLGWLYGSRS